MSTYLLRELNFCQIEQRYGRKNWRNVSGLVGSTCSLEWQDLREDTKLLNYQMF